ncbi:MAG TPA: hypothetical protein VGQ83_34150 [Polyangia bacterium]|jgi:hypothetical protein
MRLIPRGPLLLGLALCAIAVPAAAREDGRYHYCGGPGPADGIVDCPWEVSVGLSGGVVAAGGAGGGHAGLDVSAGRKLPFWLGAGGRVEQLMGRTAGAAYAEAGFLMAVLNVGLGATVRFDGATRAGPHLFVGVPVALPPTSGWLRTTHWYLEPYYRPAFLFGGGYRTFHEVGLLLKWWSKRTHYED